MNRISSFASFGLIAAGLAIMPISAFAQGGATTGATDTKAPVAAQAANTAKPVVTPGKDVKHDGAKMPTTAPAGSTATAPTATAPAATNGAKVSAAPTTTAPAAPKTGG